MNVAITNQTAAPLALPPPFQQVTALGASATKTLPCNRNALIKTLGGRFPASHEINQMIQRGQITVVVTNDARDTANIESIFAAASG